MSSNKLSDYFPEVVIEEISMRAYHIIRSYCVNPSVGLEDKFVSWYEAEDWHRDSVRNGVKYHIDNFNSGITEEDCHNEWVKFKKQSGWVYGDIISTTHKTHPLIVEYKDLPKAQKIKNTLFMNTVRGLLADYLVNSNLKR